MPWFCRRRPVRGYVKLEEQLCKVRCAEKNAVPRVRLRFLPHFNPSLFLYLFLPLVACPGSLDKQGEAAGLAESETGPLLLGLYNAPFPAQHQTAGFVVLVLGGSVKDVLLRRAGIPPQQ